MYVILAGEGDGYWVGRSVVIDDERGRVTVRNLGAAIVEQVIK